MVRKSILNKTVLGISIFLVLTFFISGCTDVVATKPNYNFRIYYVYEEQPNSIYWEDPNYIEATISQAAHIIGDYTDRDISYTVIPVQSNSALVQRAKSSGNYHELMDYYGNSWALEKMDFFCEMAYKTNFDEEYTAYDLDIFIIEDVKKGAFNGYGTAFIGTDWFEPNPYEETVPRHKYLRGSAVIHEFLHNYDCPQEQSLDCFMIGSISTIQEINESNICSCSDRAFKEQYTDRDIPTDQTKVLYCQYNGEFYKVKTYPAPLASIMSKLRRKK